MKVLLVQHVSENVESYPIGLGYVAGTLLKEGHCVDFLDLAFETSSDEGLIGKIKEYKPQALGFTLMTSQYSEFMNIMQQVRKTCGRIIVVVGGAHASADPEGVLRDGLVDIVVRGEGEVIVPQLFYALEYGSDLSQIKGIAYLDKQEAYVQTEDADYVRNLDDLPEIPFDLLRVSRYRGMVHGYPVVNIQTSRGCPHSCVFCYRGSSSGPRLRFRSVHKVFQDICTLYDKYGFRSFNFCDDIFTLKRDRILKLCEMICASKLEIFWTCETRVDCVDYQLLSHMKKSGCVCIHFGAESGSQYIIDKLQKKITKHQVKEAFLHCQRLRIATLAFFMFGTPWDTAENIRETINFAKELKSTITVFLSAMPYPGTQLREFFIESGMRVPESYREYRQFVEGDYVSNTKADSWQAGQSNIRKICMDATREIVRGQITNVFLYPRLLSEYINLYGLTDFIRRVAKRLYVVK